MIDVLLGVLLGGLIGFFSSVIVSNVKDARIKRRLASVLKLEFDLNTNLMLSVLKGEIGCEFQRWIFEKSFGNLPLLDKELLSDIKLWYDILYIKDQQWKHIERESLNEMLVHYHKTERGRKIGQEWEEMQKSGQEIAKELEEISNARVKIKDILLGV
jgi:hypothetical protein